MWSNELVLKFIEDYRSSCSCLWDVTSPDFKNREKRKAALRSLAAKYNVTESEVEKKIHNIKTSFNRERKKNASGTRKSAWFAYNYLQFLLPSYDSKGSQITDMHLEDMQSDEDTFLDTGDQEQEDVTDVEHGNNYPLFKTPKNPYKRVRINEDSPAQQAVKCMSLSEIVSFRDENLAFAEYVANKMRNCNRPRVEISVAQRYIHDILFQLEVAVEASNSQKPAAAATTSLPPNAVSSPKKPFRRVSPSFRFKFKSGPKLRYAKFFSFLAFQFHLLAFSQSIRMEYHSYVVTFLALIFHVIAALVVVSFDEDDYRARKDRFLVFPVGLMTVVLSLMRLVVQGGSWSHGNTFIHCASIFQFVAVVIFVRM
ncbi:hypothetical protein HELRODRAFT_162069 [Helobdella robusta]|uniref:MADF domain-containing protein n=1 Tax=Helobdella robusta TaxID=6412 RepID=T1ES81_HELRO|nr:hypothetical protein HELRODRAFT_162069 [Helobdella robusta]ESN98632.1 hypothetical protein HELRODRAFT_162069 [Helobdella robusta]